MVRTAVVVVVALPVRMVMARTVARSLTRRARMGRAVAVVARMEALSEETGIMSRGLVVIIVLIRVAVPEAIRAVETEATAAEAEEAVEQTRSEEAALMWEEV